MSLGRYATHRQTFSETGADNLGLTVQAYEKAWVRGRFGAELVPAVTDARVTWHGRVAWVHDFSVAERQITAQFNGAPGGSFDVQGTEARASGLELNLGVRGGARERVSRGLEHTGEFRSDTASHAARGRLVIAF